MRKWKAASLLACCALAVGVVAQEGGRRERRRGDDQQPPQGQVEVGPGGIQVEGRGGQREGRGMRRGMGLNDRELAMCLLIGNKGEVEMSTWIKGKLTTEQSKQFADMMIKDHGASVEKLNAFISGRQGQPAAGNVAAPPGAIPDAVPQPAPGEPVPQQPGGVRVAAGGVDVQVGGQGGRAFYAPGTNPFISLKQEIAQECMAMAKKELEQKQGVEVDKCFIGSAIGKHAEMISVLTVFQRHAQDSQFKEMCGSSIQTASHHLEMAKKLMKELEGKAAQ